MKNQQGQHQLNVMSINIFKEMFFVFWYDLLAFKELSLLKKLQNIKEDILLRRYSSYLPRLREHLQLHFTVAEVTQNILFYESDVLYIFDYNIVCPYEICKFIWILIWYTSAIRNPYPCLNFLIQLWGIKVDVASFLSSLMLRKVDNLQKFCSQHKNIFVCILGKSIQCLGKRKLVFVRY